MKRQTAQAWSTGLQAAGFLSDMLGRLYQAYSANKSQQEGADAFNTWKEGQMRTQVNPGEPIAIERPGGGEMQVPTFDAQKSMAPVGAEALLDLYSRLAGLPPEVSQQYTGLAGNLYNINAQEGAARTAREDKLDDRDYARTKDEESRGFTTRTSAANSLLENYDISDPAGYMNFLNTGEGDITASLKAKPGDIKALGVVEGQGGVYVPYVQNGEIGGKVLRPDGLALPDPTIPRYSGRAAGPRAKTPAQMAALSGMKTEFAQLDAEEQQAQAELNDAMNAENSLSQVTNPFSKRKLEEQIAEKKSKAQAKLQKTRSAKAVLESRIKSWETGTVVGDNSAPVQAGGSPKTTQARTNPWKQ